MFITAGKTFSSRYDKKAPIHVAITTTEDEEEPKSLCADMVVAPVRFGRAVDVTCRACADRVLELQGLLVA